MQGDRVVLLDVFLNWSYAYQKAKQAGTQLGVSANGDFSCFAPSAPVFLSPKQKNTTSNVPVAPDADLVLQEVGTPHMPW